MQEGLLIGFHMISCVQFAFSVYYDYMYTIVPPNLLKMHNSYGGKFKFLTFWDAIIQAIFFFICILNDWFGTNAVSPKKPPFIRKLKDHVHAILGFPIAMFVGIIFWTLMFVDRELVLPKALDPYFPWWLNHLMHTMIMVSTLIEMMITPRKYPRKSFGLLCLLSFMIVYLIWVHIIFYKSGIWVYPVLDVLPLPLRVVFFFVMLLITLFLYLIGEAVDNFLWGNEYTKSKKSYAKSK
ncbi:androgen-induced gene 1 protein isoform X1 [Bombus impatiens]|uniref:Androgen-induced gene 1 protein isoform X1 n=1 Tax=Bombus impatiens TaxID=132113 RepID=A0A6P3DKV7_BOMIM|nr:androgen-induced gene 1 protein isoform X1 [Bombus impatiens]XP_012247435.1 androgen-induced gene 1 protein isoform X1 [Bombus impatiens]XP_012247443.1 androgen-induced gene 1 protein isoform X1 [Bombus impatiens]